MNFFWYFLDNVLKLSIVTKTISPPLWSCLRSNTPPTFPLNLHDITITICYFLTALSRDNWHIINFTYLKWKFWHFWPCVHLWHHSISLDILFLSFVILLSHCSLSLGNHWSFSVTVSFSVCFLECHLSGILRYALGLASLTTQLFWDSSML